MKNILEKYYHLLKSEYFESVHEKVTFEEISKFIIEYDNLPSKEAIIIEAEKRNDISDEGFKDISTLVTELNEEKSDLQWLFDTTEKWCRDRAIYLALVESISIADGKTEKKKTRDAIPSILSDALAVSFDNNVGHDYLQDYEERFKFYHQKETRIQFDLDYFNKITKGGLPNKTLNIALAGTGVGKSLFMCHVASSVLLQGRTYYTSRLRWMRKKLQRELMLIY